MQNGCVEIMNCNSVFHNFVSQIIRLAICHSALHPGASHPNGEAIWVMIPAVTLWAGIGCASEFAGPHD